MKRFLSTRNWPTRVFQHRKNRKLLMKVVATRLAVLIFIVILPACSQKRLSEHECRIVLEKEIEYATHTIPGGEDRESHVEWMRKDFEKKVSICATDKNTDRKYYACLTEVARTADMRKCIDDENARLR